MADANQVVTIDRGTFAGKQVIKQRGKLRYRSRRSKSRSHVPHEQASTIPLNNRDVERLVKAAKYRGRHGLRDATLIMLAYRHGLKVSELINLKWHHVDLDEGTLLVSRLKNGHKTIHSLSDKELHNLRLLERKYTQLEFVFVTERNTPLSNSHVNKMIKRAGQEAGLPNTVAPEMLNGVCGFDLISVRRGAQVTQH